MPYGNRNCWDCPHCEQYNGFQEVRPHPAWSLPRGRPHPSRPAPLLCGPGNRLREPRCPGRWGFKPRAFWLTHSALR